jgi:hypothetical protein
MTINYIQCVISMAVYGVHSSNILLPTVEVPDILSGCKLRQDCNHAFHTFSFKSMLLHMLHDLPVV